MSILVGTVIGVLLNVVVYTCVVFVLRRKRQKMIEQTLLVFDRLIEEPKS